MIENMRAVQFVEKLQFDIHGPVVRNGINLGDVDNDGNIELVVGNEMGDVFIFKGVECWQTIHDLGFVSCIVIGDILNIKQNCLVIISADGWCHIYCCLNNVDESIEALPEGVETVDGQIFTRKVLHNQDNNEKTKNGLLECVHVQRMPANSKVALLGDVDGDGSIEIVLGLTDRVVRSYRWINTPFVVTPGSTTASRSKHISGKLVGLNKWECANQIGSVTLHHNADGSPCLLVAQPGGTFMRIKCQPEEPFGITPENAEVFENNSLRSENFAAPFVDYQFLGLSRMRNQNISTEILGDLNTGSSNSKKGKPYAVATLDGTIMLVQDEIILWAIQVDHQTFALSKLDIRGSGSDDIVVCSWDGQTYILDQEKNSVRFQLDEPVQAFCSGYYTLSNDEKPVPCLVYVTFWNKIYLYFNIQLNSMTAKRFNPNLSAMEGIESLCKTLNLTSKSVENINRKTKRQIVDYLLYGIKK